MSEPEVSAAAEPVTNGTEAAAEEEEAVEDEVTILRQEKAQLETQYKSLVQKLTNIRNTLGDKLKQDAVSLCHARLSRCLTPELRRTS
jgi:predicted  nucleic acid-binding Zn-ribbon protein